MTRRAQTLLDLTMAAVAVWFILDPAFDDLPAHGILAAIALFVIGSSLWRIWQRHRGAK